MHDGRGDQRSSIIAAMTASRRSRASALADRRLRAGAARDGGPLEQA
jgi:hypothetical protein